MEKVMCYRGQEALDITVESLQKEMAQYLQMENLNFLIGAGCSSNIVENKETGIPGMGALYQDFFNKYSDFTVANQHVSGMFDNSLERMLETLGAIQVTNQLVSIDNDIDNKTRIVQNYLLDRIIYGLKSRAVLDIYKGFYSKVTQRSRKSPINIFTTNYDLFNEMALDELGFPYNNGFSGTYRRKFNPTSYNYIFVENMNLHRDVWERVASFFNLFKLHGSISWVRQEDEIWEQNLNYRKDQDTVMIYPTPLKDRSTLMMPYSDLFRAMESRLVQRNSVLVVLGYSFGDEHINRVILNGLSVPTFRLVVFGKSQNIQKLIDLGDSRITVFNSEDKIHYFKNFVNDALPSIHPDIEEKLQQFPVNQLIKQFEAGGEDE